MARKGTSIIPPFVIGDKDHDWGGLNTANKDIRTLKRGESYDELNWITGRDKDHIELRRGSALLGTTRHALADAKATGLGVGIRNDGVEVLFYSYARKVLFYNPATNDTQETTSGDVLPVEADGENVSFVSYENLAGSFEYITSPNSSIYRIATANPSRIRDELNQFGAPNRADFCFGFAKINRSRFFGMNRKGHSQNSQDITGLYLSHVDKQLVTEYNLNFMSLPIVPVLSQIAGGGSVPDGTYYIVMTAFGPEGVETTVSPEASIVIAGGGGVAKIGVVFPNVAGVTGYNMYLSTASGVYTTPALINNSVLPTTSVAGGLIIPAQNALNSLQLINVSTTTGQPPASTTQALIAQIATGNGAQTTFVGTMPQFNNTILSGFYFEVTDGIELFIDDRSGHLVGSLGGTGTIEYVTGNYSVTFITAPANLREITASFYQEDPTDDGILDFNIDISDPTNASAQIFRQDDGGGKAQAVWPYQGVEYCFHVLRSWNLAIGQGTDKAGDPATTFNNQPYYEQIGIPSARAVFPTGDGILFLNNSNPANPTVSILQIPPGSTNLTVVPTSISDDLDLTGFGYDECVMWRFGDFDIMSCADRIDGILQDFNGVTFVRNNISGQWDKLDYYINCAEIFQGTFVAGDSLSPNIFTLFSGFDDDGAVIANYRKMGYTDLEIQGLKKVNYLNLQGLIQPGQKLEVYISLDNGEYQLVYTILGNGPYVSNKIVAVGTETIGTNVVGGGLGSTAGSSQIFANEYELDIPIHTDLFEYISFMVRAIDIGYVSVNRAEYKDIRFKRRRLLSYEDPEIDN